MLDDPLDRGFDSKSDGMMEIRSSTFSRIILLIKLPNSYKESLPISDSIVRCDKNKRQG